MQPSEEKKRVVGLMEKNGRGRNEGTECSPRRKRSNKKCDVRSIHIRWLDGWKGRPLSAANPRTQYRGLPDSGAQQGAASPHWGTFSKIICYHQS